MIRKINKLAFCFSGLVFFGFIACLITPEKDENSRFVYEPEYEEENSDFYRKEAAFEFVFLYNSYLNERDAEKAKIFFMKLKKYIDNLPPDKDKADNIDHRVFLMADRFLRKNKKLTDSLEKICGYNDALDLLYHFESFFNKAESGYANIDLSRVDDLFYRDAAVCLLKEMYFEYNREKKSRERGALARDISEVIFRYYILTNNDIISHYEPYTDVSRKIMKEAFQEKGYLYDRLIDPMPAVPDGKYIYDVRWSMPKKYEKMSEGRYRKLVNNFLIWAKE